MVPNRDISHQYTTGTYPYKVSYCWRSFFTTSVLPTDGYIVIDVTISSNDRIFIDNYRSKMTKIKSFPYACLIGYLKTKLIGIMSKNDP